MCVRSLTCRVLFVNLSTKTVALSCAPHIVTLSPVAFEAKYGDVIDPATIVRVESGVGVALSIATPDSDEAIAASKDKEKEQVTTLCQWNAMAFCHVSRLSDARVEHVERSFVVGATAQCRVISKWLPS